MIEISAFTAFDFNIPSRLGTDPGLEEDFYRFRRKNLSSRKCESAQ